MSNASESKSGLVLYVEDDENDALFMQSAYKQSGLPYPLRIVNNGKEAIEYLIGTGPFTDREQNPLPCLILLDLKLPIITGFEVLRWIREQEQFKTLPVVIYSASTQERDRELAANLRTSDYYVKLSLPRKIAELLKQIEKRWLTTGPTSSET